MAPIHKHPLRTRQAQTHVLPPRPANGPTGEAVPVTTFFSLKTFLAIMIATFSIFILTIYFWKLSSFLRRFTSHRVLGGNSKSIRYAKTWHGWVPLAEHEAKRARRKSRYRKFRQKIAWRSSHADYNWVWWDPKGAAVEQHFEDKRHVRWLPRWLKSYEHANADLARKVSKERPADSEKHHPETNSKAKPGLRNSIKISAQIVKARKRPRSGRSPIFLDGFNDRILPSMLYNGFRRTSGQKVAGRTPFNSRGAEPLPLSADSSNRSARCQRTPTPDFSQNGLRRCVSLSHLPTSPGHVESIRALGAHRKSASEGFQRSTVQPIHFSRLDYGRFRTIVPAHEGQNHLVVAQTAVVTEKSLSWKYKAWAAHMQLQPIEQPPPYLHGLAGRPGSPLSGILKALRSSDYQSESSEYYSRIPIRNRTSESFTPETNTPQFPSLPTFTPRIQRGPPQHQAAYLSDASLGALSVDGTGDAIRSPLAQSSNLIHPGKKTYNANKSIHQPILPPSTGFSNLPRQPLHPAQNRAVSFQLPKAQQEERVGPWASPQTLLSNAEVRLIYDLDRRLEWLSSEVEPGRQPFQFLLLANHWLNRSTWTVLDPVSRVSVTERREHGDPRFNYPLPAPKNNTFRPKYPTQHRVKIHAPRLDSWRVAINGARKSSGAREFLKAVELFEGSAEEPPDGAIDPASWILRRPPQGFEMSNKQANAYYEGMGGWCEKLDDWQNVCRAYRARRVICEGGANRQRIKEVAEMAARPCRKVIKRWNRAPQQFYRTEKQKSRRKHQEMRQVLSGSGSIPRHRQRDSAPGRRPAIITLGSNTPGRNDSVVSVSRSIIVPSGNSASGYLSTRRWVAMDGSHESGDMVVVLEQEAVQFEQTERDPG
ncbi:hypothetical protein PABG_05164 [Paracoccidioides brasiliensis Pb03]|nr:hypothetical protein PABG_05164 [Paracoccidioides brasiliensis Pb03]